MLSKKYIIYTDGGCLSNPDGKGACSYVILSDDGKKEEKKRGCAAYRCTTNNRMEIKAAILGLQEVEEGSYVSIYSDSQYLVNTMTKNWKKKKNKDLWAILCDLCDTRNVDFVWLRGHDGAQYNEICDRMCTAAMHGDKFDVDKVYEENNRDRLRSIELKGDIEDPNEQSIFQTPVPSEYQSEFPYSSWQELQRKREINAVCAQCIFAFYEDPSRNFKAYYSIRTDGVDQYSFMSKDKLLDALDSFTDSTTNTNVYSDVVKIAEIFPDERDVINVLRWECRGMTLYDAIKKVLNQKEVAGYCSK